MLLVTKAPEQELHELFLCNILFLHTPKIILYQLQGIMCYTGRAHAVLVVVAFATKYIDFPIF